MSNISKTSQTLYDETWTIWTTQPTQLVYEIREKSVRAFSCNSWFIFCGLILVIHVQWIFIHAALVSSRAFISSSHNKKNIHLLSFFLVIFRPQCNAIVGVYMYAIRNWKCKNVSQYLKNNGQGSPGSPGKSSEDEHFLLLREGIINARE